MANLMVILKELVRQVPGQMEAIPVLGMEAKGELIFNIDPSVHYLAHPTNKKPAQVYLRGFLSFCSGLDGSSPLFLTVP